MLKMVGSIFFSFYFYYYFLETSVPIGTYYQLLFCFLHVHMQFQTLTYNKFRDFKISKTKKCQTWTKMGHFVSRWLRQWDITGTNGTHHQIICLDILFQEGKLHRKHVFQKNNLEPTKSETTDCDKNPHFERFFCLKILKNQNLTCTGKTHNQS